MSPTQLFVCSGTTKKERAITCLKGVITPGTFGKGKKSIELETVVLFRSENIANKQHADVRAYPMDENTIAMLNAPNNALIGEFIHQHPMGPIIWEQT